jgi:hypothetical protein
MRRYLVELMVVKAFGEEGLRRKMIQKSKR